MSQRVDDRAAHDMRPVSISRGRSDAGEGSVPIFFGRTTVLYIASLMEDVLRWHKNTDLGWMTAEYSMLPRATNERSARELVEGKIGGKTYEISRLIGRTLRTCVDMQVLGENTIQPDCDVLRADGDTRAVSITGASAALADAVDWVVGEGIVKPRRPALSDTVNAVLVGVVDGRPVLDLPYEGGPHADTDVNVVAIGADQFIEIQRTAECASFPRDELEEFLNLAATGTIHLVAVQKETLTGKNPTDPRIIAGWEDR